MPAKVLRLRGAEGLDHRVDDGRPAFLDDAEGAAHNLR